MEIFSLSCYSLEAVVSGRNKFICVSISDPVCLAHAQSTNVYMYISGWTVYINMGSFTVLKILRQVLAGADLSVVCMSRDRAPVSS